MANAVANVAMELGISIQVEYSDGRLEVQHLNSHMDNDVGHWLASTDAYATTRW